MPTTMCSARTGNQQAFLTLARRYEARIRSFCTLLVRDQATAYELAQEVFLSLWNSRERLVAKGKFKELLFTIARNHCRTHLRKQRLRQLVGLDAAQLERPEMFSQADSHADRETSEARRLVRTALEALPEKFRVPLALRFVENLEYDEIARIIGRTESAARSRIHYGLKELAALLPPEVMP
jgi:RNA polymerase sigma-70 factor, ECF subfamily